MGVKIAGHERDAAVAEEANGTAESQPQHRQEQQHTAAASSKASATAQQHTGSSSKVCRLTGHMAL